MRTVRLYGLMFSAALKAFLNREVRKERQGDQVPPIRYDGDPTEIYLA